MNDSLGPLLQRFFVEHLRAHKRVSPRTITAYGDSFRLLLLYIREVTGKEPSKLRVRDLDASMILSFLDSLEAKRHNCVRTRNARLAAIRCFFRYAALESPESAGVSTRVLAIPVKKMARRLVGCFTKDEILAIIAAPDRTRWAGRRDHALLQTYYNTGARLSELTMMKRDQIAVGCHPAVRIHGKGRKEREVPLWAETADALRSWLQEIACIPGDVAFPNGRGGPLSSDGVMYILRKAAKAASARVPTLVGKRVTPHLIRHTTGTHLLQAGTPMPLIALWLGHESMETTHMYVEADLAMKERALEKLSPPGVKPVRFKADDQLLSFLATL